MKNEIIDKKEFNLRSYIKWAKNKDKEKEKIENFETKYKEKKEFKTKIEKIKIRIEEERKTKEENRLIEIINIYYNSPEFIQEEIYKNIKHKF